MMDRDKEIGDIRDKLFWLGNHLYTYCNGDVPRPIKESLSGLREAVEALKEQA